jgi:membrane fusion protein, heavy metal efflux system
MSTAQNKPESAFTIRNAVTLVLSLILVGGILVFLWWSPFRALEQTDRRTPLSEEPVQVAGKGRIRVDPASALAQKIQSVVVRDQKGVWPIMTVTGFVVARLEPALERLKDRPETRWDFQTLEMAQAYADWLKARDDLPYAEQQLETIKALAKANVKYKTEVAERFRKLAKIGAEAEKDLAAAEADLMQIKLTSQKDTFEAQTAVKTARRTLVTLERQLYQGGVDPHLLLKTGEGRAVVVAEVPEAKVGQIHAGQACRAHFYAFSDTIFPGKVASLAPTLSKERRTLRVFFEMPDLSGLLKPGMYADVDLGTEPRRIQLMPADGVTHWRRADYTFVAENAGIWRVQEVKVGEVHLGEIEVLSGLKAGDRVMGSNAILLKPFLGKVLDERNKR